jgi:ubiquinone/menaquinone biosynthesis C-methylase UbiE
MGWYDVFSRFYDASLEELYADARAAAVEALDLRPGHTVLDLPAGTGQSFDGLVAGVGQTGGLVGVDLSAGMLARARARVQRAGWPNVQVLRADVLALEAAQLVEAGAPASFDRVHVFLGLTAFPRHPEAFARVWSLLRPGGRAVVVDVYAERPGLRGRMVNLVARADIRRRAWEPLQAVAHDFERRDLPSRPQHGGTLWLATGTKPNEPE